MDQNTFLLHTAHGPEVRAVTGQHYRALSIAALHAAMTSDLITSVRARMMQGDEDLVLPTVETPSLDDVTAALLGGGFVEEARVLVMTPKKAAEITAAQEKRTQEKADAARKKERQIKAEAEAKIKAQREV